MGTTDSAEPMAGSWQPLASERDIFSDETMLRLLDKLRQSIKDNTTYTRLRNIVVEQFANVAHHTPSDVPVWRNIPCIEVSVDGQGNYRVVSVSFSSEKDIDRLKRKLASIRNGFNKGQTIEELFRSRLRKQDRNRGLGLLSIIAEAGGDPSSISTAKRTSPFAEYKLLEFCTMLNSKMPLH